MTGQTRSVVVRLTADVSQAVGEVRRFAKEASAAAADTERNQKQRAAASKAALNDLGNTAGKIGLAAAAGIGVAVKASSDFESAMSAVKAATRETASGMEDLRQAALDAGADTVFSATEAAQGIEELGKAGIATEDILSGGLTGALDLAAAGGLGVAEAAEFTATALKQFSLAGDQATHVADLLAAGAGKAQGDVRDMALALDYVGVPAANAGVSIEETAGSIALLAQNGIIGERAGTSLRGMFAALTSPSKIAAKEMDGLGISVYDAQGKFIGLEGVAGELQGRLGGLTGQERDNALGRIFGNEQLQAANVLYREGAEGVARMTAAVDDQGYAAENAQIKMDNLSGDIERLKGELSTALIETGSGSQGPIREATQGLTGLVEVYNKLPQGAKNATAALLGVTALLGGGAFVASKTIQGISNTRTALSDLGIDATKTSKGLRLLKGAGLALAGLEIGILAIQALDAAMKDALPTTEELAGQLRDLNAGNLDVWASDFNDLGLAVNRLDESKIQKVGGAVLSIVSFGQLEGTRKTAARDEVAALDEALTSLASSQGAEAATAALENLAEAQGFTAEQTDQLLSMLPGYRDALAADANAASDSAAALGEYGVAVNQAGGEASMSAAEMEELEKALDDQRKAAAETAGAFFNLGDGLNDAKVSLGGWIKQMNDQADALRNFRVNAQKAADNGLRKGLIAALQEAGPEGALRMRQLANATESEIARANKAWSRGQRETQKYVDSVTNIPKQWRTDASFNARGAYSSINALEQRLRDIPDEEVLIRTKQVGKMYVASGGGGTVGRAAGGPIVGPGSGTSDDVPILASNGEHMWTAREVANAGGHAAMEAMRSQYRFAKGGAVLKYGTHAGIPRYASGGPVVTAEERLGVLEAEKAIGELVRALKKDGKDKLTGRAREIAQTQLQVARQNLAEAKAARGQAARDKADEAAKDAADAAKEAADAQAAAADTQREQYLAMIDGQTEAANKLIDAAEEQRSKAKEIRDSIVQNMERVGAAATAGFRSSLFGSSQQSGLFAGGGKSGWRGALGGDIAGLTERQGLITQLTASGISPQAIEALLSEGSNRDIQQILSSGSAVEFDAMFRQRESLLTATASQAGNAVYGKDLATANEGLAKIESQLVLLRGELAWIAAMRPITVNESISATATAQEIVRLTALLGG